MFQIPPPPGLPADPGQPGPQYRPVLDPRAPQATPQRPPLEEERRPKRPFILSGVVAVLILAAVVVVIISRSGTGSPPASATTSTTAPQATTSTNQATVAPVATAPPPGPVLFADDFLNPKSGWAADPGQSALVATAGYQADGYHVKVLKPLAPSTTFSVGSPDRLKVASVALQVDAAFVAAGPADGVGVRCDQGARSGLRYTFQIFNDGSWNVLSLGSKVTILKSGNDPIIRRGDASNTILGQCSETRAGITKLVMTVNGKQLTSFTDSQPPGPYLWHGALTVYRSPPSPGTEVRFNSYHVYAPAS